MKLTTWFNSNVNPVHIGAYERVYKDGKTAYNYWNGKFWSLGTKTPSQTVDWKDWKSPSQDLPWRGLLK